MRLESFQFDLGSLEPRSRFWHGAQVSVRATTVRATQAGRLDRSSFLLQLTYSSRHTIND
eukprot:7381488-Prymnesium_polylepis.1